MSELFDVVVVGCDITGAGTTYHLKKFGVDRVLLIALARKIRRRS